MLEQLISTWTLPDNPPDAADCFIVLSYAIKDKTTPVLPTRVIIDLAKRWQKKFPRSYVIMSTGDNQGAGATNAAVMAAYGRKIGIPAARILEEGKSRTTFENLKYSKEIMRKYKLKRPAFVLYDLHVRRTLAIAHANGWSNIRWISASSPGEAAYGIKGLQTNSRITIFIYELLAFLYNRLRGQV